MIHAIQITLDTILPRQSIEPRLEGVLVGGPFAVGGLVPAGAGRWILTLRTVRPALAVGSPKVAELIVLLSREFEIHAVQRLPAAGVAVAS